MHPLDRTFAQRLLSMDEEVRTIFWLLKNRDLRLIGGRLRSHDICTDCAK